MAPAPAKPPVTLYFIRHGETAWSRDGRHTGRTDIALTPRGEAQAAALAPWLSRVAFAHVLCSPSQRARRTCELAGLAMTPRIEPDLAEWDYGIYEGERSHDIRETATGWAVFLDGAPGGEAPWQIHDRADRLIARLLALEGPVALFSHGQFGSALAARWIGLEVVEGRHFALSTASLGILGFSPDHPEVRAVTLWNAVPAMLSPDTRRTPE
jgi:probable phosphoglycerate mutase